MLTNFVCAGRGAPQPAAEPRGFAGPGLRRVPGLRGRRFGAELRRGGVVAAARDLRQPGDQRGARL